jgi:hypothetical protein
VSAPVDFPFKHGHVARFHARRGQSLGRMTFSARTGGWAREGPAPPATPRNRRAAYVLKVLLEAHEAAAEAARPGVYASEVDNAANRVMQRAWDIEGLWGIGHGVGLEVHE